jgi:hypothetical protein
LGVVQRVVAKVLPQVDKRIDWRVDRKLEERVLPELPRQADALSGLSEDLTSALFTLSELRRWVSDDLEAANETTVLLGESLTRLQTTLDRVEQRLARVEAALGQPHDQQAHDQQAHDQQVGVSGE